MTPRLREAFDRLCARFTDRNAAPDAESEHRYRTLIEASPAPINLFDASGEIVWGNDAVVDLLDVDSRADLVGRSIFEFIDPEHREVAARELRAVVEEKCTTGPTRMRIRTADGERKEIRVSTAPGRYDGRDIGQAVVVDVTPVEELRADLQREEQFVENALDVLQDVFYAVDTDGALLRWNDALLDRSGYDESTVRRMDVEEFFVEADAERVSRSIDEAVSEGEATFEATVRTASGARVPYEFRKRRLDLAEDRVVVVGIGRDVSERRAHDRHLEAVDRLLQHNLRNQLNVVQGSTQLLREDDGTTDRDSLDRIDDAVDRLLSMFENHRYIVELLSGETERNAYDVVPVVRRVVLQRREQYPRATIRLSHLEAAPVTAVPVLDRAIGELIDNAVEHNDRSAPVVDVRVECTDSVVLVRVADDGPPIPEMERNVVTGDIPTTSTYHSEGLGLWFVHWVADRSGGAVSFDSNDPQGNVVSVELPRGSTGWGDRVRPSE